MQELLLTLLCAFAVGYLLDRIHMPGGMMVGAVIGACALEVVTGGAAIAPAAKRAAQIMAGALMRAGLNRDAVRSQNRRANHRRGVYRLGH